MKIIGMETRRRRIEQAREIEQDLQRLRDIDDRLEALDAYLGDIESGRVEIPSTESSESNEAPLSLIEANQHTEV